MLDEVIPLRSMLRVRSSSNMLTPSALELARFPAPPIPVAIVLDKQVMLIWEVGVDTGAEVL